MNKPPRPTLKLKPGTSRDDSARAPLRSNGPKRHSGQGPGGLRARPAAATPRANPAPNEPSEWRSESERRPAPRGDRRDDRRISRPRLAPAQPTPEARPARPRAAHTARADLPPEGNGSERLNKRLAALGHCSRREADDWIAQGWVRVNGQVAHMGQSVGPQDRIDVAPRAQQRQAERATIVLHKPMGVVSGQAEDGYAPAASLIEARSQWRDDHSRRRFSAGVLRGLAPAGRLDIDSTGLLVLTQDGRVARHIIGQDSDVEKEYLVRVHWRDGLRTVTENVQSVFPAADLALLRFGLSLDGQALRRAEVDWQNPDQLRFVLREGKKRQIRRMCEAVGLHVVGLKRVRIGRLRLGQLPPGQWRFLGDDEVI